MKLLSYFISQEVNILKLDLTIEAQRPAVRISYCIHIFLLYEFTILEIPAGILGVWASGSSANWFGDLSTRGPLLYDMRKWVPKSCYFGDFSRLKAGSFNEFYVQPTQLSIFYDILREPEVSRPRVAPCLRAWSYIYIRSPKQGNSSGSRWGRCVSIAIWMRYIPQIKIKPWSINRATVPQSLL